MPSVLKPVQGHDVQILEVNAAVTIQVSGRRLAKTLQFPQIVQAPQGEHSIVAITSEKPEVTAAIYPADTGAP